MGEIETRAVEVRLSEDPERQSPGLLTGVLMPYGQRAADRPEMFSRGALYWPEGGVVLREQHNREAPITRFVPEDAGEELRVSIPLPDTSRGRDAAALVRNGTLQGLSVEFRAEQEEHRGGLRVVKRARLMGAGLVDDPSYRAPVEVRGRGTGERRRRWL